MSFDVSHPEAREAVRRALQEDIGTGDVTTTLCVPAAAHARAGIFAREPMVVAGVELFPFVFHEPLCQVEIMAPSGTWVEAGSEVARVTGPARAVLTGERTALNFVQRLSGIATLARRYVDAVAGTGCRILDTRKTTPGLRRLEKMAAAAGGVVNHRMGLFDGVLIKNNHIAAAGGVLEALEAAREAKVPIEIEVRTRQELADALGWGARHVLLDNLTPDEAREWIAEIRGRATVELSGGITLETVRAYAESGADFISVGAITHSARALNLNLRLALD